jgi:hypothetical protein
MARNAECLPASALFGQLFPTNLPGYRIDGRCVPTEAALTAPQEYADADCTQAIAYSRCPPGAMPTVAITDLSTPEAGSQCGFDLYDVGAAVDPAQVSATFSGACAPVTLSPGAPLLSAQGAPVAADRYPSIGRVESGTGRIKVRNFAAASGPPIGVQPNFYDSVLGVGCLPLPVGSPSVTVCFPENTLAVSLSPSSGLFADPSCTVELYSFDHACGLPDPSYVMKHNAFAADMLVRAVPYTGMVAYAGGSSGATACVPTTPPPGTTLFTAGDPVPISALVPVVETME